MASATCRSCGAENTIHARFCKACGESLAASVPYNNCPACQAVNRPDAKFCKQCGHSFVKNSAPPPIQIDDDALVKDATQSSSHRTTPALAQQQPVGQVPLKRIAGGTAMLMLVAASWWWLQRAREPQVPTPPVGLPHQAAVPAPASTAPTEVQQPPVVHPPATAVAPAVTAAPGPQNTPNAAGSTATPPASSPKANNGLSLSAQQTAPTRQPAAEKRPRPAVPEATHTQTYSGYSSVESTHTQTQQVPRTTPQPLPPQVTIVTSAPVAKEPTSPSDACGKRVLLAQTICMQRECDTPRFAQHPQCIQFKQQQLEFERNRQLGN